MKFELKPLSKEGVPAALKKAEHYRLLNEPLQAESICTDVLDVEPDNQQALITLALAMTDQFTQGGSTPERVRKVLARVTDDYARAYYTGLACERRATAQLEQNAYGAGAIAYDWYRDAMHWYEKAEEIRPVGNDNAILRWNTCARMIMRNESVRPTEEEPREMALE